jgi:hypothetical protein
MKRVEGILLRVGCPFLLTPWSKQFMAYLEEKIVWAELDALCSLGFILHRVDPVE